MNKQYTQQNNEALGAASYFGIAATLALVAGSIIHSAKGQPNNDNMIIGTVQTEKYTGISPDLTYTLGVKTKQGTFVSVSVLDGQHISASSLDALVDVGDVISFPKGSEVRVHQITRIKPHN